MTRTRADCLRRLLRCHPAAPNAAVSQNEPSLSAAPLPAVPLSAEELAAREWPGLRASIIDIAATLDRLDAAGPADETARVRDQAEDLLRAVLTPGDGDRARRLLEQMSRPYDHQWRDAFAISADT